MGTKYYFKGTKYQIEERKRNAWEWNIILREQNIILRERKDNIWNQMQFVGTKLVHVLICRFSRCVVFRLPYSKFKVCLFDINVRLSC